MGNAVLRAPVATRCAKVLFGEFVVLFRCREANYTNSDRRMAQMATTPVRVGTGGCGSSEAIATPPPHHLISIKPSFFSSFVSLRRIKVGA